MRKPFLFISIGLILIAGNLAAQEQENRRQFQVQTAAREALVFAPAKARSEKTPLVFAFHGHGGTMENASIAFHLHTLWPEAIVVYPQGVKTPGRLTDPEGKRTGWQARPGTQNDRDLKFFDVMLADLKKEFQVDENRIYATGHSNGGGFTYILWAERSDIFAAMAPSASTRFRELGPLKPKPVLHIAGERDDLVKFEWQKMTIETLKTLNKTSSAKDWPNGKYCKIYDSTDGPPVVALIHPGGHSYNREAPEAIVAFFKKFPEPVKP
ncbi:MAG: prolyl oligopeptidase family serine peptidase [Planctomycetota bacterium]|nr:prolyl oligopeptidase family serine peptidase [Planctomycetota bacterium]